MYVALDVFSYNRFSVVYIILSNSLMFRVFFNFKQHPIPEQMTTEIV